MTLHIGLGEYLGPPILGVLPPPPHAGSIPRSHGLSPACHSRSSRGLHPGERPVSPPRRASSWAARCSRRAQRGPRSGGGDRTTQGPWAVIALEHVPPPILAVPVRYIARHRRIGSIGDAGRRRHGRPSGDMGRRRRIRRKKRRSRRPTKKRKRH
jgi:hypothetical protein